MNDLFFRKLPIVNSDKFALVDDDYDGEWLSTFTWYLHKAGYVFGNGHYTQYGPLGVKTKTSQGGHIRFLSRMAYGESFIPKGHVVTQKNRDKLDCRTSNLVCLTRSDVVQMYRPQGEGYRGRSGFRGVHTQASYNKEYITASCAGSYIKNPKTGRSYFATLGEAARAYDAKAHERWGDRAILNFPEEYK